MKLSKWIYNLGFEEYLVISVLFILSVIISFQSIKLLNIWNKKINNGNKFFRELRASPIPLFGLSIITSAILFLIFGDFFVNLLEEKIN